MTFPGRRSLSTVALAAAVLSIGVLGARATGQAPKPAPEPQQPVPVFRAGTAVVRVDVTATTRDEPVTDLTTAEFEVTEDEVPQEVQTSQFIRVDG